MFNLFKKKIFKSANEAKNETYNSLDKIFEKTKQELIDFSMKEIKKAIKKGNFDTIFYDL